MKWPFAKEKAAPQYRLEDAPLQPNVVYLDSGVGVALVQWNSDTVVREAMRHPIIYRAITKLCESVQQARWLCEVDPTYKGKVVPTAEDLQNLQDLLDAPNPDMTGAQFRYWLAMNFICFARAPFKVSTRALRVETPNGLYPLDTTQVRAVMSKTGSVTKFNYGQHALSDSQSWPSRQTYLQNPAAHSDGYVAQLWRPGLKGYVSADDINSPLQAISLPARVLLSLLKRAISSAEGHPNVRYMVTCSKTLTKAQLEALKEHLNSDHATNGNSSGKVPVLQNAADVEIHKLDNDLSDIHSKTPADDMARLIFGAFGIPIALAGIGGADAAKFAGNYDSSRAAFWQDTIIPGFIDPLVQGMTMALCPPGLCIVADLDTIPVLNYARINAMQNASNISFLTTTEKRALFGWSPNGVLEETSAPKVSAPKPTN